MRTMMRAGYLFALMTLASCAGDSSSTPSSSKQSAVSTTTQPAQSITLTTDGTGLVQQATANGVTVQLEDRFQSAVIARRNADGSVTTECHDDQHQAESFVQGAAAAVTASGVK